MTLDEVIANCETRIAELRRPESWGMQVEVYRKELLVAETILTLAREIKELKEK